MWWHKLVTHWSKRDYVEFSLFSWVLIFCTLVVIRTAQDLPLELPFTTFLALIMIPVELTIVIVLQKYSSHMDEILNYPVLQKEDFINEKLLKDDKTLVFFYAEWCPFCRAAFHHLASLSAVSYKVFRLDLSDEENPIWSLLKIKRIPTLIAFDGGKEFWRREATYMIGLRKADFNEADSIIKAKVAE